MNMKKAFLLLSTLFLSCTLWAQGYEIKVKIRGVEKQQLILGVHKGSNLIPVDTTITDQTGSGIFKKNKKLTPGIYIIYLPSRNYFDILIADDQTFSVETDTSDLLKKLQIKGALESEAFLDYQNFMIELGQKMNDLNQKLQKESDENKKEQIQKEIENLRKKYNEKYTNVINTYPNTFLTKFLKATRDIEIPENITDLTEKYNYYKAHYFDNFDLSDISMLYTPIYDNKIDTYFDKVVVPLPDSVTKEIDFVLSKAKKNNDLYQYLLVKLYNKYAKSTRMIDENIFVYIADIYIQTATWAPDSFKNELKTKITRRKNCLIGNTALNMKLFVLPSDEKGIENLRAPLESMKQKGLEIEKDKSRTFEQKLPELSALIAEFLSYFPRDIELKNIKAKYTILWFLSPTCSHCIEETPKFFKDFKNLLKDKDVVVLSILLEANTDNWKNFTDSYSKWFDFILENKFFDERWYNLSNPFDNFRFKYDISSSPVLYLLDKDKKIIAKRIDYQQAIEIILDMEKTQDN